MNEPKSLLDSDGNPIKEHPDAPPPTERTKERKQEEEDFISVIIKRSDAAQRHPDDTLEKAIEEGSEQLKRPAVSLWLSSMAGGMIVGFSAMAVAVMVTLTHPLENVLLTRLASALVYPLGFVICIMSGAQLFTEHTATSMYPFLDRRSTFPKLLRLWSIVIAGNLIGAAIIGFLLSIADNVVKAKEGYLLIGEHLTEYSFESLFVSAVLAGWLMALGAWLVLATPPDSSQIMVVFIVTFVIGLGGLHHSIAGSAEMFTAWFIGDKHTPYEVFRFIGIALLGNTFGGSIFVAVLNYAHIRQTQVSE
ncbi:Inner membrane protein YfdC [Polystyrenella longa]|uniref:Inner membrane protein YfdC n=1 Tax=Polystyrenella longa TaxID=2528007 RepID=A0A518CT45_9PLAN|nr:formate/nitrite transporter family protein [Polystyrenella longa]QDU82407.1 Inner membrane protein YfdC [Polystyrenella longa]